MENDNAIAINMDPGLRDAMACLNEYIHAFLWDVIL